MPGAASSAQVVAPLRAQHEVGLREAPRPCRRGTRRPRAAAGRRVAPPPPRRASPRRSGGRSAAGPPPAAAAAPPPSPRLSDARALAAAEDEQRERRPGAASPAAPRSRRAPGCPVSDALGAESARAPRRSAHAAAATNGRSMRLVKPGSAFGSRITVAHAHAAPRPARPGRRRSRRRRATAAGRSAQHEQRPTRSSPRGSASSARERAREPDAVERQDRQQLERIAGLRHEPRLEAARACPTKTTRVAGVAPTQLVGHRDPGKQVAAGAARRDQDRAPRAQSPCCDTLSTRPTPKSVNTSDEPPALMNGSGMPLVGSSPSTTLMLMNAWSTMASVRPAARKRPNASGALPRGAHAAPQQQDEARRPPRARPGARAPRRSPRR